MSERTLLATAFVELFEFLRVALGSAYRALRDPRLQAARRAYREEVFACA
jgi:hypothetical protein